MVWRRKSQLRERSAGHWGNAFHFHGVIQNSLRLLLFNLPPRILAFFLVEELWCQQRHTLNEKICLSSSRWCTLVFILLCTLDNLNVWKQAFEVYLYVNHHQWYQCPRQHEIKIHAILLNMIRGNCWTTCVNTINLVDDESRSITFNLLTVAVPLLVNQEDVLHTNPASSAGLQGKAAWHRVIMATQVHSRQSNDTDTGGSIILLDDVDDDEIEPVPPLTQNEEEALVVDGDAGKENPRLLCTLLCRSTTEYNG